MTARCSRKLEEKSLEAIRIGAVRRVLDGENADAVMRDLGFSRGCIYEWLRKYRVGGWEALKARRITGRPHRLTEVQQAVVYQTLVQENPLLLGLGSALWTRAMVAAFIRRQFQVHLSRASVGRLLQEFGLITQRPWHRAYEQNPGATERWLNKDYKQIRLLARHARAEIVFLDVTPTQCGICEQRACASRPATAVEATSGRRLISAVSPKGQIRFMVVDGQMPAEVHCEFIRRLMQGRTRPLFLVVPDNPVCHERLVRECAAAYASRLRLFALPTAASAHGGPTANQPAPQEQRAGGARTAFPEPAQMPSPPAPVTGILMPPTSPVSSQSQLNND